MKTNLIIFISLVVFVLGAGIGFMLGFDRGFKMADVQIPLAPDLTIQEKTLRMLIGHETTDSICANMAGQVVEVGENRIVIINNQERAEIKVEPDAHIARFRQDVPAGETIRLDQIRTGEPVTIYAVITEQGEIIARGISVHIAN